MTKEKILELVSQMTLEEKAGLTSGKDGWFLKAVERLGIPSIRTSDGPHGLRRIDGAIEKLEGHSTPAVCFPAACATAASFDRELLHKMGVALGKESQNQQVDILLGILSSNIAFRLLHVAWMWHDHDFTTYFIIFLQ